jgi:hypothetical protein
MERRTLLPGAQMFHHIVVRFQDHIILGKDSDGKLKAEDTSGNPISLDDFHQVVDQAGGKAFQSFPRIADDLRSRGLKSTTGVDRYAGVIVPRASPVDIDALRQELENLRREVVFAVEALPYVRASPPPEEDLWLEKQRHLRPRRDGGVGAECVWGAPGARGQGILVGLCDFAWKEHVDLPSDPFQHIIGSPTSEPEDIRHGNAAFGVIAAIKDNDKGVTGISPDAKIVLGSTNGYTNLVQNNQADWEPFDEVLDEIYEAMDNGGIVVLEMQASVKLPPSAGSVMAPAEINPQIRAWIREAALQRNILTVEAAGTRLQTTDLADIDAPYIVPEVSPEQWEWRKIWNGTPTSDPNHSLALIVGGGDPDTHRAVDNTNHGSRVNCQGWGAGVVTTWGTGFEDYTENFNGSSSATAMVGGMAASVLGAARAVYGQMFPAFMVRNLLSNPLLGIPQPEDDPKHIGPLPDLAAILRELRILPDVYMRDHIGDGGAIPYTGPSLYKSPDIIVMPKDKLDETDQAFWDSHFDQDLGGTIDTGGENEVFVRLHNRSRRSGTVKLNVYWTEPGTFLDPGVWKPVNPGVVAVVPEFDHTVVKLPWTAPQVPKAGWYCLIATVDSQCDPLGIDGEFKSFDAYKRFLRYSNNIAHRNVQAKSLAAGETTAVFRFYIRGIPRRVDWENDLGHFRLEIGGGLPRGTRLNLSVDEDLPWTGPRPVGALPDGGEILEVPPPLILRGFTLPAGARIPLRLEVKLPVLTPPFRYHFHADQFHDEDHLGRVNFEIHFQENA